MVSNISSSLSALLSTPYAQGLFAPDSVKPGSKVTANFVVNDEGQLALREVSVTQTKEARAATVESVGRDGKQRNLAREQAKEREASGSFSDVSKPKAQLSPADELALFATTALTQQPSASFATQFKPAPTVLDEDGNLLETEEVAPRQNIPTVSVAAQRQQQVAGLYARNSDAVYAAKPVFSEAA